MSSARASSNGSRPRFTLRAVAALFLERQHLDRPRGRRLNAASLARFVADAGGLQLDSINVLARAHEITTWSRFAPFSRRTLDALLWKRRVLFEYWAHAACLVPRSDLAAWKRAMADYEIRHTGWTSWLKKNRRVVAQVEDEIRTRGAMSNAEFKPRRPAGAAGWWNWKPATHALHWLWMSGRLLVDSRVHFQKRYDLAERVLPEFADTPALERDAFQHWHLVRSFHAMGAATEQDLAGYLTFPRMGRGVRRAALRAALDARIVREIEIPGDRRPWFALAEDLDALAAAGRKRRASRGTALLAPFDSLMWYRGRVSRLFGFDYRIEVYTPGHKRVHGYYSLPILHDGQLVGRLDAKTHRGDGVLEVRAAHFEKWFRDGSEPPVVSWGPIDRDDALAGIADAIGSLADFVGAAEVRAGKAIPRPLAAACARIAKRTAVAVGG